MVPGFLAVFTVFIGFCRTFLVQHWLGVTGMPRRVASYPFLVDLATTLNYISFIGLVHILGASTFIFFLQHPLQDLMSAARFWLGEVMIGSTR